jgi:hypothetical protein
MTNLSHHLTESASMYPDHPAVRMDDQVLTYAPWTTPRPGWSRCCAAAAWSPATGSG